MTSLPDLRVRRPAPAGRAWPLPALVLAVGLLLSLTAALQVEAIVRRQNEERFAAAVSDAQQAIRTRLQAYVAVLRATDGLFAANDGVVTREAFRAYAEGLELPRVYPGVQGLGYSARLPAVEGPATRELLRRLGVPGLVVRPATPRDEVHAIVHLEPMDRRNIAALGFDMYSEPVRREAMARARDTGRSAMSGKVELVQEIDEAKQAGFLIYHPVYRGSATAPATVAERRERLQGFAYAPFRAGDLLRGIFGGDLRRVDIAVYDGAATPGNLLFQSFEGAPERRANDARLSTRRELEIAGRTWFIAYSSTAAFEAEAPGWLGWGFFGGGLFATLLLAGATWREARARRAAETENAARREGEHQRRLLVGELNHRVKNTLATVQSIAAQALREGKTLGEARETFEARLLALSHTHDLLTRDSWRGAELGELARLELAPYRSLGEQRLTLAGPPVFLPPETALALGMALHELATNAAKYGALSTPEGRVQLTWELEGEAPERRLRVVWQEVGGPPVSPPKTRGFGTRLIAVGLRRQLGGQVDLTFPRNGVRCRIDVPLEPAAETQPQP